MMDVTHLPLDLAALLALAAGLGWASVLRLYTTLFIVGLAGRMGWLVLPEGLRLLEHPWVLGAAGLMLLAEFFADKCGAAQHECRRQELRKQSQRFVEG